MNSRPHITILIRASRPELFNRCIKSVENQTYTNWSVIISVDRNNVISDNRFLQSKNNVIVLPLKPEVGKPYYWNLYCNVLKLHVPDNSFFFFLDCDDYLASNTVLQELSEHLTEDTDGLIVQFLRNGKPKPNNALIEMKVLKKGLCGGGCVVLNSKHKHVADWQAKEAADWTWIEELSNKINFKFVPFVLQVTGNNGLHGFKSEAELKEHCRQRAANSMALVSPKGQKWEDRVGNEQNDIYERGSE